MHIRKALKNTPPEAFVPWTTVSFQTEEARDRFLLVAANLPASDVEVEPLLDQCRGASVRWRLGKFLALNDVAHSHGGRIAVTQRRGA